MAILIKGMEMPKNCDNCPCYYETEGAWRNECQVVRRECEIEESRPSWCPLIEVPKHGDLTFLLELTRYLCEEVKIIEAEGEDG